MKKEKEWLIKATKGLNELIKLMEDNKKFVTPEYISGEEVNLTRLARIPDCKEKKQLIQLIDVKFLPLLEYHKTTLEKIKKYLEKSD